MGKDLKIEGISLFRYRELKYFCLQYPEWKERLKELTFIKASNTSGMYKSNNLSNNNLENLILKKITLEEKCKVVEQSAIEADVSIYQALLKNVTEDVSFYNLNVACSKGYFYKQRQKFFKILSKKYKI